MYRLLLIFLLLRFETLCSMCKSNEPEDFGFIITTPITRFLIRNIHINDHLALCNTLIHVALQVYLLGRHYYGNNTLINKALFLLTYRQICGFLTKLPIHKQFKKLESSHDIPPKHYNFFFHFSAHTFLLVIIGLDIKNQYKSYGNILTPLFILFYILQSIRLLATRGHYSIDIANGTMFGYLIHHSKLF